MELILWRHAEAEDAAEELAVEQQMAGRLFVPE